MSISRRLTLLLLFLVACSLGSLFVIARSQAQTNDRIRQERGRATSDLVARIVALHGAPLALYAADYTVWDDMVRFAQTCDSAWAAENIGASRATFHADAAWVLRPDGTHCYAAGDAAELLAAPALAVLGQSPPVRQQLHTFVRSGSSIWEVRAATIHPTTDMSRETPSQGWFVVAQRWDDAVLADLGALLNGRVSLTAPDSGPTATFDANAAILRVCHSLLDFQGAPVAQLTVEIDLPITGEIARLANLVLATLSSGVLLTFVLLGLGLYRWVAAPLAAVTQSLQTEHPATLNRLAQERAEFGQLARLVQAFFAQRDTLEQEIAARRHAEANLRAERDFAHQIMHTMGEGLTVTDSAGRFTFVNDAYAQLFGYDPGSMIGRSPYDLTLEADHATLRNAIATRQQGQKNTYITRLHRADGRVVSVQITGAPRMVDGKVVGAVAVITDLSERLAAEEALRRREAILQAVSQAAARFLSDDSWEAYIDPVLDLLGTAAQASRAYLFTRETTADGALIARRRATWLAGGRQAQGDSAAPQTIPMIEAGHGRWVQELRRGAVIYGHTDSFPQEEQALLNARGIRSIVVVPVFVESLWWGFLGFDACDTECDWSAAEVEALQAAAHLISATIVRAGMTAALRASEARFRAIWERARDGMALIGPDGALQLVNPAGLELCSAAAEKLLGQHFTIVLPENDHAAAAAHYLRAFQHPAETFEIESSLRRADGAERRIEVAGSFLVQEGRRIATLTIVRDITQRRQLEQQFLAAQRRESIGVLAGGVAHDFNNILAVVAGQAELLLADSSPAHPAHEMASTILVAAQRATDLTRQLLAYAGKGRFVVEPGSLNSLAAGLLGMLETVSGRRCPIVYDLSREPTVVLADRTQIEQVLLNLVLNAAEATVNGSAIRVTTHAELLTRERLDELMFGAGLPPGRYIALSVTDRGQGMDAATRQRIFEPFFSTKFTGRGLGLAAVQGIVHSHQGALQVVSAPGQGTTITIWLPEHAGAPPAERATPPGAQPALRGAILVIDDEAGVRDVARRLLEREGLTVYLADDGAAGLALAQEHANALIAVLLDVTMPQMSGAEVARRISTLRPELPIVLMSGYSAEEIGQQHQDLRLAGVLQKPFTRGELRRALAGL